MKKLKITIIFIIIICSFSCKNYQDDIPKYGLVIIREDKFNSSGILLSYLICERDDNGVMTRGIYYDATGTLTSSYELIYGVLNNTLVISRINYFNSSHTMTDYTVYDYDTYANNIKRSYYNGVGTLLSYDIRTFEYYRNPVTVTNYNTSHVINYIEYNTLGLIGQIEMVIRKNTSNNIISSQNIHYNFNRLRIRINNYNSSGNLTHYFIYHYR